MTDTQAELLARARECVEAFPSYAFDRAHTEALVKEVAAALQSEREAAAAEARRAAIEECVAAVDVEEELDGDPPQAVIKVMLDDPPEFLRATVRATKRGIRNRIRALASPAPQEETR